MPFQPIGKTCLKNLIVRNRKAQSLVIWREASSCEPFGTIYSNNGSRVNICPAVGDYSCQKVFDKEHFGVKHTVMNLQQDCSNYCPWVNILTMFRLSLDFIQTFIGKLKSVFVRNCLTQSLVIWCVLSSSKPLSRFFKILP